MGLKRRPPKAREPEPERKYVACYRWLPIEDGNTCALCGWELGPHVENIERLRSVGLID